MKPDRDEAYRELTMTVAKIQQSQILDPSKRADDHLYLEALDKAIKRVEASEAKPLVGDAAS